MIRVVAFSALCCATVLATSYVHSWSKMRTYSKPTVINTWPWQGPNNAAWRIISTSGSALSAVVAGCTAAEEDKNITSVGAGGSPDEDGNTTLSAMVMDGDSMNDFIFDLAMDAQILIELLYFQAGAVAEMAYIRQAAQVALGVLNSTRHTLLVGEAATRFAESLGYQRTDISSDESTQVWKEWKAKNCQPNFRAPCAWIPNPRNSCGPYKFKNKSRSSLLSSRPEVSIDETNHDTIGIIALDKHGRMAVGMSTNGVRFRVPGRVGDSPIPGAGGYADSKVGAAAATGDGDVMMRFLLSFKAVELMRAKKHPNDACHISLRSVRQRGTWYGALIALRADGQYGAACVGFKDFAFVIQNANTPRGGRVIKVKCLSPRDLYD
ncbi:unnamed protein product [Hydatigera taeniaeformis]|uniref:N(4)-(Beta-N-acetylglucosaminyl)-L-asparaginase n=1 Tax=Hydatigena taeniaeformis TaxID=6205 RepID=A0A0R3X8E5_HYDTA|nr:unnamed protein product [Hydatigera taeniaeformis]